MTLARVIVQEHDARACGPDEIVFRAGMPLAPVLARALVIMLPSLPFAVTPHVTNWRLVVPPRMRER